jgi:dihydropteroate synthase
MGFVQRQSVMWQLRTRGLQMGVRTLVMGIVNVTPDSFSGDGLGVGPGATERAVAHGLRLLEEGAGALDLGGESTRPGSGAGSERALTAMEEQDRVLPVVEGLLRERPEAVISIDTYRSSTAQAAVAAGAEIVNDVSGLLWDDGMAAACAALGCGVVVMHTRGRPGEWKTLPALARDEVVPLVLDGLGERLGAALAAGIAPERVVLDPGYGFGKAWEANYALLAGQDRLLALGRPLLAGVSRKSFLGKTLGELRGGGMAAPEDREQATIAACVGAVLNGASALRVHAVKAAVEAAAIADALAE